MGARSLALNTLNPRHALAWTPNLRFQREHLILRLDTIVETAPSLSQWLRRQPRILMVTMPQSYELPSVRRSGFQFICVRHGITEYPGGNLLLIRCVLEPIVWWKTPRFLTYWFTGRRLDENQDSHGIVLQGSERASSASACASVMSGNRRDSRRWGGGWA